MKLKLALSAVLVSCAFTANAQVAALAAATVASPVLSVISIARYAVQGIISANQPEEYLVKIRVIDPDQQIATKLAFKEACNQAYGSVINSELQSSNGRLTKDSVTNYSSCYIKKHEIVSREIDNNGETVWRMDVVVASNKLADRVLGGDDKPQEFNGAQHIDRVETYKENKLDGDALISQVMADYPSKAYNINIDRTKTVIDTNRNPSIRIEYTIAIDEYFAKAFHELIKINGKSIDYNDYRERSSKNSWPAVNVITKGWLGSKINQRYKINDQVSYERIKSPLNRTIFLLLQVTNNGNQWNTAACWKSNLVWDSPYLNGNNADDPLVGIWVNNSLDLNTALVKRQYLEYQFETQREIELIRQATEIKLVPANDCNG